MKNKYLFSSIIFLAFTAFFSCNLVIDEDANNKELKYRPDVTVAAEKGIIISTKIYTDNTQFINLYRGEVKDANDKSPSGVFLLGTLNLEEYQKVYETKTTNKTYQFQDLYVKDGGKYKYKMQYYDSKDKEFTNTNWSNMVEIPEGKGQEKDPELNLGTSYFKFEETTKTLSLIMGSIPETSQDDDNTGGSGTESGTGTETGTGSETGTETSEETNPTEPEPAETTPAETTPVETVPQETTTNESAGILKNEDAGNSENQSESQDSLKSPEGIYDSTKKMRPVLIISTQTTPKKIIPLPLNDDDKNFSTAIHLLDYLPDNWWSRKDSEVLLNLDGVCGSEELKGGYIYYTKPKQITVKDSPFKVDTSGSTQAPEYIMPE